MLRSTLQTGILTSLLCLGLAPAQAQEFFTDFTTVPAGAYVPPGPIGDPNEAQIADGVLKLTLNQNGSGGIFYVDDFSGGAPISKFRATFKAALFGSLCCGGGTLPADGFSFNLTPSAVANPGYNVPAEEGLATGLAVCFDTWDNGGGEAPSIDVKWNGTQLAVFPIQPSQSPTGGSSFLDVVINLDLDGTIDVSYGGRVIFSDVPTPYTAIAGGKWVFGARTGGANDNHFIDDLRIVVPSGPVTITRDPANTTVTVGRVARFSADVDGAAPYTFQWFKNDAPIEGATSFSLVTAPVTESDNGAVFTLRVTNALGFDISAPATLTVNTDVTPPTLVSAFGSSTFDRIVVNFSETLQTNNAADTFNYSVSGGLSVTNAYINQDQKSVTLILDGAVPQAENTVYTVTVREVYDEAGNAIAPESTVDFRSNVRICGGLQFEVFLGIGGTAVPALTSHPNYPNNPQRQHTLSRFDTFEIYPDGATLDNYGGRVRGFFIPPESGNWIFYLRSDDASQLFLNPTGPDASGKTLLTEELGCCGGFATHPSQPQALIGGQPYYIEAIYKEGGGGDYVQVAAKLSTDPTPPNSLTPIPGAWLGHPGAPVEGVGPVVITQQPADTAVQENTVATISVGANNVNSAPICYQWRRNGVDIPGANLASYSFVTTLADNGAVFSAVVGVLGHSTTSGNATLTVTNDVTPPAVVSASGSPTLDRVTVNFSEPVDDVSAANAANYSIAGLTVSASTLNPGGMSVRLTTSPQTPGTTYTVVVSDVRDKVGNAVGAANSASFSSFVASCGFLLFESYDTGPGTAISILTGHPTFPNNPRERLYMTAFDTRTVYPNDSHENYGARVTGFFVPPTSGNWIFYLRSDDASQLFLNPAGLDPAGKILLTEETGCCQPFSAHASAPQALTAGQMYYIEGLLKEGGGGDYLQVAAKLDTDPTPPNSLRPIGGGSLGLFADPTGVTLAITQQPADATFVIDPGTLFSTDFNSGNGGFTVETPQPYDGPWTYDAALGGWRQDGQAPENSRPNTSRLNSPTLTVTRAGGVRLTFAHRYSFEGDNWDGGNVRISVNGAPYALVPASAFVQNGYNGAVRGDSASVLRTEPAFVLNSVNYATALLTTVANLGNFNPGDTISVQFVAGADTNTRGPFIPNWQVDSFQVAQGLTGSSSVTFAITAEGSSPSAPGRAPFIQWQRDTGSGFVDLPGATGPTLTFVPTLADNGARYRAVAYLPGATSTSDSATLTVVQANTPPRFTGGPDQTVNEDAGPQSVLNWATGISVHSIDRSPIIYGSAFDSAPPGSSLFNPARVDGGILHLTDASQFGAVGGFYTPSVGVPIESYRITYRAYVGGGTCCGNTTADGYSINIANDLPNVPGGSVEDGFGSGLSVAFDTWDNGGGEAPSIELKWQGNMLFRLPIDVALDGAPTRFADVSVEVSAAGVANVSYDGTVIFPNITLTGWTPQRNLRVGLAARTGGASDNHWIDDLSITAFSPDASSAEANQTIQFIVSNDNPSLFAAQPAVSPDGTLTYTPAANACGEANVTVVAQDSGGTAFGGRDSSAPYTFTIAVSPVNDCPLAGSGSLRVPDNAPTSITLTAADADANGCGSATLTFTITSPPSKGTLSGVPPNVVFTPVRGMTGADSFSYVVNDGVCDSSPGVVSLDIFPGNQPPINCLARITPPTCVITVDETNHSVITLNRRTACVILVGSAEDPDGNTLQFTWLTNGVPFAIGPVATNCFPRGEHEVTLVVSDGSESCASTLTFSVVKADVAVEDCVMLIDELNLHRKNKRPLIASLKNAAKSFSRGNFNPGINQLEAFQRKVRAQIGRTNPDMAADLIECAQQIIDAIRCAISTGLNNPPRDDDHDDDDDGGGSDDDDGGSHDNDEDD